MHGYQYGLKMAWIESGAAHFDSSSQFSKIIFGGIKIDNINTAQLFDKWNLSQ